MAFFRAAPVKNRFSPLLPAAVRRGLRSRRAAKLFYDRLCGGILVWGKSFAGMKTEKKDSGRVVPWKWREGY